MDPNEDVNGGGGDDDCGGDGDNECEVDGSQQHFKQYYGCEMVYERR